MNEVDPVDLELAIVGMAGRFPGAPSIAAFWNNLRNAVESIRDLGEDELRQAGVDKSASSNERYVRRAADIENADLFDAGLFGFTPREAQWTDPQFRIFLEDCWTALENAGHHGDHADRRIGVFAGSSPGSYLAQLATKSPATLGAFQTSLGNERDYLAAQVSYRLNLHGPSFVVQTACSTSLVAVHLACQSLLNQECDLALAGGVSISIPQTEGYVYEEGDIASPDGRCRAFDETAAGCIKGNGSGVVVLRRLEDAKRDGDHIYAIVKGSAVNNDGHAKVGFTAPSTQGQSGVIAEALAVAGVDPSSIGYVETHGTGTPLGDPIEIRALSDAFQADGDGESARSSEACALGSVKTNIGHLDAAAGVAGLIKATLALHHREIPASLHFTRPNPKLDLPNTPFYVNATLRPWPAQKAPRRAGVSSFGIGGTNAHVILEEAPVVDFGRTDSLTRREILPLSAATETALSAAADHLATHLESNPELDLADVAHTLQIGRRRMAVRRTLVAGTIPEAVERLRETAATPPDPSSAKGGDPTSEDRRGAEVAFLFPGQGAQRPDMVAELYAREPVFRQALDRCCQILEPMIERDLRPLIVGGANLPAEERAEALRHTSLTQPALFAVEYSLAQLWMAWGVQPAAMAGHSIGEYVAACLAEVMSLNDALRVVSERARLMGRLDEGAMLAVHATEAEVHSRLADHADVDLAVINGPQACVISGPVIQIEHLETAWSAEGLACRRLRTSHAFHSAMMEPALEAFEAALRTVTLSAPRLPFLSNVTGTWITEAQATDPAYWVRHLRQTVRFHDNLTALASDHTRVCLEVGPGSTLTQLLRQAHAGVAGIASLPGSARSHVSNSDDHLGMLSALGELWCAGVDLDWRRIREVSWSKARRIPLPTYPFERSRHWIDEEPAHGGAAPPSTGDAQTTGKNPQIEEWFYVPGWRRSYLPAHSTEHQTTADDRQDHATSSPLEEPASSWLIFDDGSGVGRHLAETAPARGARPLLLRRTGDDRKASASAPTDAQSFPVIDVDPSDPASLQDALQRIVADHPPVDWIVHLWTSAVCAEGEGNQRHLDEGFHALLTTLQVMGRTGRGPTRLAVVTQALFDVTGDDVVAPARATAIGICRVAPQETPQLHCRLIDFGRQDAGRTNGSPPDPATAASMAEQVLHELGADDREPVVARRNGHRWVPSYQAVPLPPNPAPTLQNATVLIAGGAGELEHALARRLIESGARAVAILDDRADSPTGDSRRTAKKTLGKDGVEVFEVGAPLHQAKQLQETVDAVRKEFGRIDLVVHTPGPIGGGMIQLKERGDAERILAPRVSGLPNLVEAVPEATRVLTIGSAISVAGVFGQVDYCGACAYLDAFAHANLHRNKLPRVQSVGFGMAFWDRWQDVEGPGGDALTEQLRSVLEEFGITVEEGVEALMRALALDVPQVVISPQNLDELIAQSIGAEVGEFLEGVGDGSTAVEGPASGSFESEVEARIAAVWKQLLGVAEITRQDNFFDLGGNSLLAIQLASQLRQAFDIDLSIASLFESADLSSLAGVVDAALEERRTAEEVARLLDEIETLSDEEIRQELAQDGQDSTSGRRP